MPDKSKKGISDKIFRDGTVTSDHCVEASSHEFTAGSLQTEIAVQITKGNETTSYSTIRPLYVFLVVDFLLCLLWEAERENRVKIISSYTKNIAYFILSFNSDL
jgi:hypothetical protein